jgi:hypothetical protein
VPPANPVGITVPRINFPEPVDLQSVLNCWLVCDDIPALHSNWHYRLQTKLAFPETRMLPPEVWYAFDYPNKPIGEESFSFGTDELSLLPDPKVIFNGFVQDPPTEPDGNHYLRVIKGKCGSRSQLIPPKLSTKLILPFLQPQFGHSPVHSEMVKKFNHSRPECYFFGFLSLCAPYPEDFVDFALLNSLQQPNFLFQFLQSQAESHPEIQPLLTDSTAALLESSVKHMPSPLNALTKPKSDTAIGRENFWSEEELTTFATQLMSCTQTTSSTTASSKRGASSSSSSSSTNNLPSSKRSSKSSSRLQQIHEEGPGDSPDENTQPPSSSGSDLTSDDEEVEIRKR